MHKVISQRVVRTFIILALLIVSVSMSSAANASNPQPQNGGQSWSISLTQNTQLQADQFEEALCLPNSAQGQPGQPPPKLMGWDSRQATWVISLTRQSILRARPNCADPSYIASQIDSISPLSQTLNDRLFAQGSYRVMYPGRVATWRGIALGSGFQQSGAIGTMTIGWQSGEPDVILPDGTIDFSQYKVQSASFVAVATADPLANLQLNGGETVRIQAFFVDYREGTFFEELLTQYPASFFRQPHDYSIAWVDTSSYPIVNTGCSHPFEIVFSIDNQVVAVYTNGTTSTNLSYLGTLQGGPQVGLDQRVNAKRCTNPKPTQLFAGISNPDAGGLTVGNAGIPPVPLTMTIRSMSIERFSP